MLISQRILFKKIAIMYEKGEFSNIKGTICNVPVETSDVCRPTDGLVLVKLKHDLRCRRHVYFESVRTTVKHTVLYYLKMHNKFYEDISVREDFVTDDIINFCDSEISANETDKTTEDFYVPADKESNDTTEDPLTRHRVASNETALVSEIPNIVENENLIVAPGQGKTPVAIPKDEFCE